MKKNVVWYRKNEAQQLHCEVSRVHGEMKNGTTVLKKALAKFHF